MSLFSRDVDIYVSSVTYSLGEEPDKIPDLIQAAVITAGIQGTSRPQAIKQTILDGGGVKLTQAFHYARNNYYAGLPTGFPRVHDDKSEEQLMLLIREYMERLYPLPANTVVITDEAHVYDLNIKTRAEQLIEAEFKYDFAADAVYEANNGLAIGATIEIVPLPADGDLHPDDLGFQLTFTNPDTSVVVINKWYPETDFVGQDEIKDRITWRYSLNGAPFVTRYYEFGGDDSRLNLYLRTLDTPESFTYPAIVLKKAKTNKKSYYVDQDAFTDAPGPWQDTPQYITSKRYCERLGVDMDGVIETIRSNADQKEIDYAFIQPGTKINSPNLAAHEYHYRYFERLYTKFPSNKAKYDAWMDYYADREGANFSKKKAKSCPNQSFRIQDPDSSKSSVNMELAWRYITYEVKNGTLPKAYTIECGPQELIHVEYKAYIGITSITYDVTKLYLRKRLTNDTYGELCVCGLWHENYVYKKERISSGVWDAFNDPDGDFGSGFVIPLQYDVLITLSARERLQLAQESLHLILNCYKIVKEKWYQTGAFKVFVMFVAMVIIVWSMGSAFEVVGSLYGTVQGSVAAAFAGTAISATVITALSAVITALIVIGFAVGIGYLAKEAGEWAAEQWGPAWGAVVQIVAIIALTYMGGIGLEGLGMAITPATLPMTVLNVTNAVLAGLATYTNAEMALIKEAQNKWMDYIGSPNNPMDEVNRLMEELFPNMNLTQEAILYPPRENLEQFLGRTLGAVDSLIYRLTLPITAMPELTLTPRLI